MKTKLILSLALLSLSSIGMAASLTSMSSSQAKNTFSDKTITTVSLATLNGNLVDNQFIGYFNKDGTMMGKFEKPLADGSAQTDKGTWQIKSSGEFCFTWQNWDNAKERCVTLYKLDNAILVIGDTNKFETLILNNNIQDGNQLGT